MGCIIKSDEELAYYILKLVQIANECCYVRLVCFSWIGLSFLNGWADYKGLEGVNVSDLNGCWV